MTDLASTGTGAREAGERRPVRPAPEPEAGDRRPAIEALRLAVTHMSGAERRLRGRDHIRPGELTYAQIRALAALGREHEMTAGQLARSADLNPATVTGMLDQLESANVVQRRRSTEDRRVCHVSLTAEGWNLLERKLAAWQTLWEQELADISDRDLEAAAHVLKRVGDMYQVIGERLGSEEPGPS